MTLPSFTATNTCSLDEPAFYAIVYEISVFGFIEHLAACKSAFDADLAVSFRKFQLCHEIRLFLTNCNIIIQYSILKVNY